MQDETQSFFALIEAVKLTKKRVMEPTHQMLGGPMYHTAVECSIWTDQEIETLKKEILTKLKLN